VQGCGRRSYWTTLEKDDPNPEPHMVKVIVTMGDLIRLKYTFQAAPFVRPILTR